MFTVKKSSLPENANFIYLIFTDEYNCQSYYNDLIQHLHNPCRICSFNQHDNTIEITLE